MAGGRRGEHLLLGNREKPAKCILRTAAACTGSSCYPSPYPADPSTSANPDYLGVGRGEDVLWEDQYFNVNTSIPLIAQYGVPEAHDYIVSITQGYMSVSMDGVQVFSGHVSVPPVAYLYVTASTGQLSADGHQQYLRHRGSAIELTETQGPMKTKNTALSLALLFTSAMVAGAQQSATGNNYNDDAGATY